MVRFSTGTVQNLAKNKTLKEMFNDAVLRIYTGSQPTDADNAINGTLLYEVTLNGGTFVPGTKSTAQIDKATITSHTENQTFTLTVNGTAYTYTAGAGSSDAICAAGLAALVNESDDVLSFSDAGVVYTRARFAGNAMTIVSSGSGTISAVSNVTANSRAQGIQFGSAVGGVLSKESGTWQGNALADGTAAWWRVCGNAPDNGGLNTILPRMDGNCSTTTGDMIIRTLSILTGDPIVISSCDITIPKVRT